MNNSKLLNDPNKVIYSEILNENSTFILSGYFWGSNRVNENSIYKLTYQQQVDRLVQQCRKFNVNYYFVRYPIFEQKGMYITALSLKSQFILNTLTEFPNHKIINIDTDFSLQAYPHIFDADADCFFINWYYNNFCTNSLQLELPGGILGFANTHNAKTALKILNKYILQHPNLAEDKTFSGIFTRNFFNVYTRCIWLPYNYMYMYEKHIYKPDIGYTHIASDKEEFTDNIYSSKDIVIAHKDLETYELHDVRKKRIGTKSIWPPNFYRQQGQKLRCFNKLTFFNYIDYGLGKQQIKQFNIDFKERAINGNYINKLLPIIKFSNPKISKESFLENKQNFIVISIIKSTTTDEQIETFKNNCHKFNLNYIIYYSKSNISKPQLFHKILQKYKQNIVYMDINYKISKFPQLFNVKNMDFMTINMNNIDRKCYDPRILQTFNDDIYFFGYNNIILQFLQIWNKFNTDLHFQHKGLEFAFNKSLSINKLRCYWLPKSDTKYNHAYGKTQSKYKEFIKKLPQCGIKPPLDNNSNALKTHFYGSKIGQQKYDKYSKLFLEY